MNNEPHILAVDTSTAVMAGAAFTNNNSMAIVQTEAERNHSIHIMTNIEKLIKDSQWTAQTVTHYVVGIGPGSYTGVRIAVTAAKTLAWINKKTIVAVSSLEGLAYSAVEDTQQEEARSKKIAIIPIMDARRGQVYTALFSLAPADSSTQHWQREHDDHITLMETWVDRLTSKLNSTDIDEVWVIGDTMLHEQAINRLVQQLSIPVQAWATKMNGTALAKVGQMYMNKQDNVYTDASLHLLAPNYAQLTEAEVKQNEKDKLEKIRKSNDE